MPGNAADYGRRVSGRSVHAVHSLLKRERYEQGDTFVAPLHPADNGWWGMTYKWELTAAFNGRTLAVMISNNGTIMDRTALLLRELTGRRCIVANRLLDNKWRFTYHLRRGGWVDPTPLVPKTWITITSTEGYAEPRMNYASW